MNARHNALGPGQPGERDDRPRPAADRDERARLAAGRVRCVVVRAPRQVHALLRRGSAARAVAAAERPARLRGRATRPSPSSRARARTSSRSSSPSSAEDVLRSFARSITHPTWFSTGKGGHGVLVLGPGARRLLRLPGLDAGARARVRLRAQSRIAPAELSPPASRIEDNAQHDMTPGEDGRLATLELARRRAARHRRRRGRGLVGLAARPGRRRSTPAARRGASARPASRCRIAGRTVASFPGLADGRDHRSPTGQPTRLPSRRSRSPRAASFPTRPVIGLVVERQAAGQRAADASSPRSSARASAGRSTSSCWRSRAPATPILDERGDAARRPLALVIAGLGD